MSEWQAHVHCTCFQNGLTTEPPYPRSALTINRFGVVTMIGSTDHSEDPEDLWNWRAGYHDDGDGPLEERPACAHHGMQLVCVHPFYTQATWRRMESLYPHVEHLLDASTFPSLNEVFYRHPAYDYPSGGIWVRAQEAPGTLAELSRLSHNLPADLDPGDGYFIESLCALLRASVLTRNPVICHNNGVIDGAW